MILKCSWSAQKGFRVAQLSLHRNKHIKALYAWSPTPLNSFRTHLDKLYTLHLVCADAERIVFWNSFFHYYESIISNNAFIFFLLWSVEVSCCHIYLFSFSLPLNMSSKPDWINQMLEVTRSVKRKNTPGATKKSWVGQRARAVMFSCFRMPFRT